MSCDSSFSLEAMQGNYGQGRGGMHSRNNGSNITGGSLNQEFKITNSFEKFNQWYENYAIIS